MTPLWPVWRSLSGPLLSPFPSKNATLSPIAAPFWPVSLIQLCPIMAPLRQAIVNARVVDLTTVFLPNHAVSARFSAR